MPEFGFGFDGGPATGADYASSLFGDAGQLDLSLPQYTAPAPIAEFSGLSTPTIDVPASLGSPNAPAPSGMNFLDKLLGGAEKEITGSPIKALGTTLGLGATGLGIANQFRAAGQLNQQNALVRESQKRAQSAAAPAVSAGTQNVQRAERGELQPAMEQSIANWVQQAKADLRARYAKLGLGNSTDITHGDALIDQMALAMRGQLLQGEEALGFQGLQTGVSAAQAGSQTAQNQQNLLAGLIETANQQLGLLSARQG